MKEKSLGDADDDVDDSFRGISISQDEGLSNNAETVVHTDACGLGAGQWQRISEELAEYLDKDGDEDMSG